MHSLCEIMIDGKEQRLHKSVYDVSSECFMADIMELPDWTHICTLRQMDSVEGNLLLICSDQENNKVYDEDDLIGLPEDDIVDKLMFLDGAWCVIFYNSSLRKLFIGRDVFGRFSLVFSKEGNVLKISRLAMSKKDSYSEVPHGQVTVINTLDPFNSAHFYTYFDGSDEENVHRWHAVFSSVAVHRVSHNDDLITLSRDASPPSDISKTVITHVEDAIRGLIDTDSSSVAVCLSGGVDSLLISRLLGEVLPPSSVIDLINVAFISSSNSSPPDRIRSISALRYLRQSCPSRVFRLICVDVSSEMLTMARSRCISHVTIPCRTVLDDSLSCVLWFALRGVGKDYDTGEPARTTSDFRLVGSGADELFAGYARHRHAFLKGGLPAVAEECEKELRRLGSRNGGRDDRVALQLGIALRSPFLQSNFVRWANQLPVQEKAQLNLARGVGEKILLRKVLIHFGAPSDAPKQAMQFGSGMVKMERSQNSKGSDKCEHLIKDT